MRWRGGILLLFLQLRKKTITTYPDQEKNVEIECYGTEGYNLNLNYIRNTTETSFVWNILISGSHQNSKEFIQT